MWNASAHRRYLAVLIVAGATIVVLGGCEQKMAEQGRFKPLDPSSFFPDGQSSRPVVLGTIARKPTGTIELPNPTASKRIPFDISRDLIVRGRQRFDIYCAVCHGRDGYGNGIIVQHGFTPPPSFHIERLRNADVGHFYDVITNGYGAMYSYADRVSPEDRWAIIAFIRTLQLSQHANIDAVPESKRQTLQSSPDAEKPGK